VLPTKFQLIWPNGFRDFFLIGLSQTRTAYGGYISCTIRTKDGNFVQGLPYIIPTVTSNNSLCLLVSKEKIL